MPTDKEKKDPSTTSAAYNAMAPAWKKINTLLGGTEAMRAAGRDYAPQWPEESDEAYQFRVQAATLFNQTEITLNSWVGRPFSDEVNKEDIPPPLEAMLEDVDLEGNNIDVFARNWFRGGVAKAFHHVLIDFPRVDSEGRTLEDDMRDELRPYWVDVPPEALIFASGHRLPNGREVLTHVRIRESETERDGFAEMTVNRIRVMDVVDGAVDAETGEPLPRQVVVTMYREKKKGNSSESEWEIEGEPYVLKGIDFIPLVTFYADRDGLMFGKPPLLDLADINITHWQSTSEQRVVLSVGRFPMLGISGATNEEGKIKVGPHKVLHVPDPQGKIYYVEHEGKAIEAGRTDIRDLEEQMSAYGAEFLKRKPGNPTATARALDSAESTSPLQDMAIRFNDALAQALEYSAAWMRAGGQLPEEGEIGKLSVASDFGPEDVVDEDLKTLTKTRELRDISQARFLAELKRRGALAEDFDEDANKAELEAEAEENIKRMAALDLDPGGGDGDEDDDDDDEGDEKDDE